ncbi:MAG TPA: protocatechuate 3,4-dioxygenase subunit alpha [Stellaceae bacterium]|nr:protocatechuate 3,4-dioxygenase subunit alpha [Stellaceae bacterium]
MAFALTQSQTIGPFFNAVLRPDAWSDLVGPGAQGTVIQLEGRVIDGQGAPVTDATVEIWQANAAGRYDHPEDTQDKPLDPAFHGFGRAPTDPEGRFRFRTVLPGPVPGLGNVLQAPHVNVSVFARGLLNRVVTRIYFAGNALNDTDPVLSALSEAERTTLLANPAGGGVWQLDIILQGEGETVFFEV